MAQDIIELSQIAHEYHQEFGYQEYITWVKDELKLAETQGRRFLNVYDKFGSTANLAVIDIAPSALYLLSQSSTPDSAREEALELAESGETVIVIESIVNNIVLHIVNYQILGSFWRFQTVGVTEAPSSLAHDCFFQLPNSELTPDNKVTIQTVEGTRQIFLPYPC